MNETIEKIEWFGLYNEGWRKEITPEAFAHPAKFSRGLIRRIYEWLMENGHIRAGDKIVDPFGGVGLGALDAMRLGMHWEAVELEPRFHAMGQGIDCGGFTADEWRRYYRRSDRIKRTDLCPRCRDTINRVPATIDMRHGMQLGLFNQAMRAVPTAQAHHYSGNIELWREKNLPGTAVLHLGDSRNLASIVGLSKSACVSSPPYSGNRFDGGEESLKKRQGYSPGYSKEGGYADNTSGQLGSMKEGDLDACVSSPPFAEQQSGGGLALPDARHNDGHKFGVNHGYQKQGTTPGQLGAMPMDDFDVAISSPPYADAVKVGEGPGASGRESSRLKQWGGESASSSWNNDGRYGLTPGQLGNMSDKGFDGSVSSPPYEASLKAGGAVTGIDQSKWADGPRNPERLRRSEDMATGYSDSPENIGNDTGDTFWQAARTIVEQTYAVLKPGGVAAWVTGDFVRNSQRVFFGEQWLTLCRSCGFEPLAWAIAWKTEYKGTQMGIFGGDVERRVDRVSFFRQLANKRNPETAILNEDVVFVRKPYKET